MGNSIVRGTGIGQSGSDSFAFRNGGVLHRSAIAAVDKIAVAGTLTVVDGGAGGGLPNSAMFTAVAAGNRWGTAGPGTLPGSVTPTASHWINIAFAQVTGADYYDIFCSTAAAPLWVCRITEAQRAAGSIQVTVVGTVAAGASAAGSINIGVQGTGLAENVAPYLNNNAYTPATPTLINCAGFSKAHVLVKGIVTDLRSLPAISIIPFFQNQVSTADWHQGSIQGLSLLSGNGQTLEQDFVVTLDGATGLVVLVDTLTGQGITCTVWVELV